MVSRLSLFGRRSNVNMRMMQKSTSPSLQTQQDVSQGFMDAAIRSLNASDDVNSATTVVASKVRSCLILLNICIFTRTHPPTTRRFRM